jgi:hypothetical protein
MAQLLSSRSVRLRGYRQPIWPLVDRTHPINRGLTGYWPFDGQSISTTTTASLSPDGSGFGNDATITAASLVASHHGGLATSFSGNSTSHAIVQANVAILGALPRTFSFWANATSVSVQQAFFGYGSAANLSQFVVYVDVTGVGSIYFATDNGDWHTGNGVIAANTWAHIAVAYTGGNIQTAGSVLIYVNGVSQSLTAAGSGTGPITTTSSHVEIGSDYTNTNPFTGAIEGFRQYNRVLDPVEISQLYAEPYAGIIDITQWSRVGVAAAFTLQGYQPRVVM